DVASLGKEPTRPPQPPAVDQPSPPRRQRNRLFATAAVIAIVAIGALLLLWHPWRTNAQPTLVVRAAATDAGSRSLARDLAVELGSLQGVQSNSIRLLSETEAAARRPDLIFEISQSPASSGTAANVA